MVALSDEAAALRSEVEAGRRRARDAETLAGMAGAASEKLGVRLKEASAENDQLAAAAARVRKSSPACLLVSYCRILLLNRNGLWCPWGC